MAETGRQLTIEVICSDEQLGRMLRDALEEGEPEALVGAEVRPGYQTIVDGRFDLAAIAHRFLGALRASRRR